MKKVFVTGAAGFVGSNLVDRLLAEQISVVGWDNYSTGRIQFLSKAFKNPLFQFIQGDNLDQPALTHAMKGCDLVVHFAANADVRFGVDHPEKDLQQNTIATFNVLEAMRAQKLHRIVFSSTGSVYGESTVIPTPEGAPFPVQTSLYGASKVAGESLIQAYCAGFGFEGYIFRFVSLLGDRYSHGHVFDFYKQLLEHPERLSVLGNGHQKKSYLHIKDCIDAIFRVLKMETALQNPQRVEVYNLGTKEYCEVRDSIRWICEYLQLKPTLEFTGSDRGWIGDNPFIFLDTSKIQKLGWSAKHSIQESIVETLKWIEENRWVYEVGKE